MIRFMHQICNSFEIDLPVSHIYTLTVPPVFNGTGFVANSTPIVGYFVLGSYPLIYLLSKCVLPTLESPSNIILKMKL